MPQPSRRARRRAIQLERLEDRLTPAAGPFEGWLVPAGDELAEQGIVQTEWNGESAYAFANQWIASFDGWIGKRDLQLATLQSLLQNSATGISPLDQLGRDGLFLLQTPNGMSAAQLAGSLSSIAGFAYVEPNFMLAQQAVPTDPSFPSQWALNNTGQSGGVVDADIDAPEAWNLATGSSGVVVGIIDSGIDYTHPDLINSMWVNPGEIAGDGLDNDGNGYIDDVYGYDFANNDSDPMDDDGHGTACAGIVAASANNSIGVSGINWGAKVMALKYAKTDFVASTADVIEAINYATMMRRDYGINVRATSNSYGIFGNSQAVAQAIQTSGEEGIIYVASAGNSNTNNDLGPQYPASFQLPNVLSVAATTRTDAKASFSSYGANSVHLGAPGVDVLTTRLGGSYSGFSGTSAAAPMVAGVAALLFDYAPYASVDQVVNALLDGTDPIPSMAGITITGGRLNAYNAMLELGFQIVDVTPDVGTIVTSPPTEFTVRFSTPTNVATLDAADFTVNGIAAQSVSSSDGGATATFTFAVSPVTTEGLQQMAMADGSVQRQSDGDGLVPFTGTFRYDATPLAVVASTPSAGSTADVLLTEITLTWNELIDPASVGINDLILSQGDVVSISADGPQSIVALVEGIDNEGSFTYWVPYGAVKDSHGNPSQAFQATVDLDVVQRSVAPFDRIEPLGSAILASLNNKGQINAPGDVDEWLFPTTIGERVTVIIKPAVPGVLSASFYLENGNPTALGDGSIRLSYFNSSVVGLDRVIISGSQAVGYTFDVYRGADAEFFDTRTDLPLSLQLTRGLSDPATLYAVVGGNIIDGFIWNMDANPGWVLGTGWGWGQPAGQGGDPSSGYTGNNVVGYNLSGAYTNSIASTRYARLGPIDLTGKSNVSLSFRRWLGIESSSYDHANIQVSTNGTTWTTIWDHVGSSFQENTWSLQTYDISAIADNKPTVYVRWGMGPTDTSVTYSGWNIDDVIIAGSNGGPVNYLDEDAYQVDLSASVGHSIDVLLNGLGAADFSSGQLELIDPDGNTVAFGEVAPAGINPTNSDLSIFGFAVTTPGTYTVVVRGATAGKYSLVVADNGTFEAEPNDSPAPLPRSLDETGVGIGFVGVPIPEGGYSFTIDSSQSLLTLAARVRSPDGTLNLPIVPQSAGSLDATMTGSIVIHLSPDGLSFQGAAIDLLANAGSFQPFGSSADFAGQVNLLGLLAYAAIRNVGFTLGSDTITIDPSGFFDATGVVFEFTDGEIAYSALGSSDSFPVNSPDSGNSVSSPGQIEYLPGQARLTIPFRMAFTASVPLGFLLDFEFTATVVATTPLPIDDPDYHAFSAQANEQVAISLSNVASGLLLDEPLFLPTLTILDPDLSVVATVTATAENTNPSINFTAEKSGTYLAIVTASSGRGEYQVLLATNSAPTTEVVGPSAGVRSQPLNFDFVATDTPTDQEFTFEVDWDGDGSVDETIVGPGTTSVTHAFPYSGDNYPDARVYNVGVRAIDELGAAGEWTVHPVTITPFALQADPSHPGQTNLVVGGLPGQDVYFFFPNLMTGGINWFALAESPDPNTPTIYGTVHPVTGLFTPITPGVPYLTRSLPGPSGGGHVIVYGGGGNDELRGDGMFLHQVEFHGGADSDILIGGSRGDILDGGAGNDIVLGGALAIDGNDTISGGDGDDVLIGQKGADVLHGGAGRDLVIGGSVHFAGYVLGRIAEIQAEWANPNERTPAQRQANILGTGVGPRNNGNTFLVAGVSALNDQTTDQVMGDEGEDWLWADTSGPDADAIDAAAEDLLTIY